MTEKKNIIQHKILNVLTMANFAVADLDILAAKKKTLLDSFKLINYLIVYEDVFLNKKRPIPNHKIDVLESLEVVSVLLESELAERDVNFPHEGFLAAYDRVMLKEYLLEIVCGILQKATYLKIKSNVLERSLEFSFDSNYRPLEVSGHLMDLLASRSSSKILIYQLALKVLMAAGLKIEYKTGFIKLVF